MRTIPAAGLLLAAGLTTLGLSTLATPALALQIMVTHVDKNSNGTKTYHFVVKTDPGETLSPGATEPAGDFVTVYNFYGLVDGSVKSPSGWSFSSEASGRTPMMAGYPLVLPLDVPNTPNLTWTVTKPVAAGSAVEGFTATTRVDTTVAGEYTALVTRQMPAAQGVPAGMPGATATASKQALIGMLPTPSYLADVK